MVSSRMDCKFTVTVKRGWIIFEGTVVVPPGQQADLIMVFFDPMGQALCKRTLDIVEKLSETCGDRLLFYLSKADEAGRETDRQVKRTKPSSKCL